MFPVSACRARQPGHMAIAGEGLRRYFLPPNSSAARIHSVTASGTRFRLSSEPGQIKMGSSIGVIVVQNSYCGKANFPGSGFRAMASS